MPLVMIDKIIRLYLGFCGVLHKYYKRRDSTPAIFVYATSTVVLGLNCLFLYDFTQLYFIDREPLTKRGIFFLVVLVGIVNYLLVFRSHRYRDVSPSRHMAAGSLIYIIVSLLLMIFIGLQYRMLDDLK